jgi:hypothetical protein
MVNSQLIGFLEKIHRPPQYLEQIRIQVAVEVATRVPFFNQVQFLHVFLALAKVAPQAPLLGPQRTDQGNNRLAQFAAFLGNYLHSQDDQDHAESSCNCLADKRIEAQD